MLFSEILLSVGYVLTPSVVKFCIRVRHLMCTVCICN